MNEICARNRIGSTPSAANVAASTRPADVITPPVTASPRRMPSGAVPRRLLAHPRHEEDVVVHAERDEEHEPEQRHHGSAPGKPKTNVEHERGDAQRCGEREHDRGDQQERRDDRAQQQHQDHEDHEQHERDDEALVGDRRPRWCRGRPRCAADEHGPRRPRRAARAGRAPSPRPLPSPPGRRASPAAEPRRPRRWARAPGVPGGPERLDAVLGDQRRCPLGESWETTATESTPGVASSDVGHGLELVLGRDDHGGVPDPPGKCSLSSAARLAPATPQHELARRHAVGFSCVSPSAITHEEQRRDDPDHARPSRDEPPTAPRPARRGRDDVVAPRRAAAASAWTHGQNAARPAHRSERRQERERRRGRRRCRSRRPARGSCSW